jgi:aquaporin Z
MVEEWFSKSMGPGGISRGVNDSGVEALQLHSIKGKPEHEPWQHEILSHSPEYGAEFLGTVFLVFCVVAAVAVMFAPASPVVHVLPSARLRLFVTGSMLGGAGGLVAITPLGRISGAHLNPAISLGFFAEGKMQLQDLFGYIIAQLGGGVLGAWAGAAAVGRFGQSVQEALNAPARGVSNWGAAGAEVLGTFCLALIIFETLSVKKLMHWTPLVVVGVASVIVGIDGNFSGASLNPARSFGPAWIEHQWGSFWIYVIGPSLGGLLAGLLHRHMPRPARTGKLFHDLHYRSIFTGRSDKLANIHVRRHGGTAPGARPRVHSAFPRVRRD